MNPIDFEHANITFAKDQPEYKPLPALRLDGDEGQVITCWQLSDEEKAKVMETGLIWLNQWTFNKPLQPINISTNQFDFYRIIEKKDEQPKKQKPTEIRQQLLKEGKTILRTKILRKGSSEYYVIVNFNGKGWSAWSWSAKYETEEEAQKKIDASCEKHEYILDDAKIFANV